MYEGYENFSFQELDYEIKEKDIKFLNKSAAYNILHMSQSDFERVIDVFEKIVFIDQKQSKDHLVTRFYEVAPKEYCDRITKQSLEIVYSKVSY